MNTIKNIWNSKYLLRNLLISFTFLYLVSIFFVKSQIDGIIFAIFFVLYAMVALYNDELTSELE